MDHFYMVMEFYIIDDFNYLLYLRYRKAIILAFNCLLEAFKLV